MCYCGLPPAYEACCGRYIDGPLHAPTPEALMRSRYSAFVLANIPYVERTMRGASRANFNSAEASSWAEEVEWLGLKVLSAPVPASGQGVVEFIY